ncbi:hypothetical protein DA075_13515 [Methylobacterium currus]|uniref:ComEC/Rec2-related protein domain-containing protein n=1 Tax=Methylobacterium currus TaxID=2051553 RepID=A0A2R4WTM0_9HYPH|nr:hypothetical protein DA075_13515 [Methylobacterium currus]
MPELCPSCLRDYASTGLRHADVDFPVRPVDKEHREKWMGHRKIEDISDGYGRFRPEFLITPRVATEAFLRDLDRRSGGALFRQGPDKTPLRGLYPARREDDDGIGYRPTHARAYVSQPVSDNDDDPDPGGSGIQSDVPGATRGTVVVLGAKRDQERANGSIPGPFRQIADKPGTGQEGPEMEAIRAAIALLAENGIRLFEREVSGGREVFLVAPAETLVPVSAVPDLLRLARPRLRWPKRLPGNPKIGRLARLRPADALGKAGALPANLPNRVSISGLHMVLAAGVVFWLARALLALGAGLALAWPIKKIAAALAMVGVTGYCAFSGWDLAAERSLVMTLVMLGAILVDRPALSLRNLALAALISLAREPEGLLGPSFQMSFGAVAGLIACARLIDGRLWNPEGAGPITRALAWCLATVVGTLATTLVAQVATAPFATYHFQTVQPFGLVGNALTLPLVSLVVMPSAVLGILAYPFALDRPVWWAMGLAVRGMIEISAWIQGFDRATLVLPAFGPGALGLMTLALLLLVLPVSGLRWLGLAPGLLGLALAGAPERRDLYVDREGGGAALRGADGRLVVLGRPPAFVLEQWLKADGDGRSRDDPGLKAGARCDKLGCVGHGPRDVSVALVRDKRAFPEDCARATVVVSRLEAPPGCAAAHILDRKFLAAHGATTLRFTAEGVRVETAKRPGETRPWRPAPVVKVPAPAPPAALVPRVAPQPMQPAAPEGEEAEGQGEP